MFGVGGAVCVKDVRERRPGAEMATRVCVRVRACVFWRGGVLMCFERLVEQFVTMAQPVPLICSWELLFGEMPWLSCRLRLW